VFSRGFVIVGNVPVTYPGGVSTPGQGSLQIFDRNGNLVSTLNDATLLDSPWDLTINDEGSTAQVYVSNLLSGTVTRLNFSVSTTGVNLVSKTLIGSGYGHQIIPAIVAVGPTGLAFDPLRDVLYVASTADNEIFGIGDAAKRSSSAGTGFLVYADQTNLHGPLGLVLAPNGNLITANGDGVNAGGTQNELVEFTKEGTFVASYQLDGGALGAAFGIASSVSHGAVRFAAVDDDLNTLTIWTLRSPF
jgi:DNA-binding beta-propeller fold protein YncE